MLLSDLEGVEHTASCREDPKKQIPSMRGILYVCFCVFSLTLGTGLAQKNKNITLYLVRELALRGVGDVVLTARFSKNVNAYIRRHTDERVQTSVYSVAPDVMIVARAWFMGDPQNATDSYNTVSGIFDSWENQVDDILVSQLNNASLRELGVQPRIIELSDQCEYGDTIIKETSEDFGFNNLTLEINMTKVSEEDLLSRLCSVLAFTDCSLIVVDVTRKDYIYSTAVVTITSPNRNECLIMLMNNFRHASPMFPENIESILVAQVEIYRRYGPNLTEVGMFQAPCSRRFWYLIFLLLLFPLSLFIGNVMYYHGIESGKRSTRELERDIRGGVRYQDQNFFPGPAGWQYVDSNYGRSSSNSIQHAYNEGQQANWLKQKGRSVHFDPNENWQRSESQEVQHISSSPPSSGRQKRL